MTAHPQTPRFRNLAQESEDGWAISELCDLLDAQYAQTEAALAELADAPRPDMGRIWFWKPQWHWFGWKTLIPFSYGHDEHARRVLCFGWAITGRMLIAVWGCGDPECESEAAALKAETDPTR